MLSFMVSSVGAQTITMQELEYSSSVLGHKTITVKIADAAETTAVQMNLSLPEGYALTEEGIALSDAINDHIISVSPLASGDYLIVVYSLSQSTFKDGTLLVIPLSVDANAKNDEAVLHTMRTSTADAVSHACTDTKCLLVAIPVLQIAVNPKTAILVEGETLELTSSVRPADATNQERTWSSSDESVATVDNNGVVTAVAAGTATITVKAGGKEATCVVTVEAAAVEPEAPKVESGEYYLYNVGEKKFLSRGEHWGTCATVDKYGIPFVWTAEEYSLKFLDSNVHLFETNDNNLYTDNASTGFAFEYTEGGYLLKSQKSDRYLTIVDKAHTLKMVSVTNDAAAASLWQPMTKAEHDAIVAGYVEENYTNVIAAAGISATAGDFIDYLATLSAEDKTSAIGTARFNGNAGEWKFTEIRHQDWQPAYGTDFCEMWQATGYHTQTITDLPEGIYKVTMQGFERAGGWATCNTLGAKGYEITTATLSANGEEVNLKSWYSDKTGENNPNNTGEAVAKFGEGKYMNELYTYVGADGTLTLMVNKPSHVGDNWMLFNNFTLTRYAEVDTGIDMTTDNRQQTTVIYDLMGRKVESPAKGIYIVNGKKVIMK